MAKGIYYFGQTEQDYETGKRLKNAKGTYTHFFTASDRETFNKNYTQVQYQYLRNSLDGDQDFSEVLEVYRPEDVIRHLNGEISVDELFHCSICVMGICVQDWEFNETRLPNEQEREDLTDILHDLKLLE